MHSVFLKISIQANFWAHMHIQKLKSFSIILILMPQIGCIWCVVMHKNPKSRCVLSFMPKNYVQKHTVEPGLVPEKLDTILTQPRKKGIRAQYDARRRAKVCSKTPPGIEKIPTSSSSLFLFLGLSERMFGLWPCKTILWKRRNQIILISLRCRKNGRAQDV